MRHLESLDVGFKFFFRPRQSRKEPVQFELPVKTISPNAAEIRAAGSIMRPSVRSGTGKPAALKAASITVPGSAAHLPP